jgi:oligoendopeptidase F
MSTTKVALRSEIPVEYTWDLASIYGSPAEWEATMAEVKVRLPHVRAYAGRLGEGPGMLAAWMDEYQALMRDAQRLAMYAFLGSATDATDQEEAARVGQANSLGAEVQAAIAFAEPELMAIGFDTLRQWIAKDTRLAVYEHYIDDLERMSAHIRSGEVEEVLGQIEDPFRTSNATHGILANSELQFAPAKNSDGTQTFEVTHGSLGVLLSDADREVRRTAWENYADAHLAFKNTMANNLAAGIKQDVVRARVRRYDSSLEAALYPDSIPLAVFHNLIDVFKRNLPTWHRYWRLRRKALGVETLHEWDIKAPLASGKVKVPYSQAVEWICEGMAPLGEDYVSVLRRGCLQERWVDIYPNKGKRLGAFSYGGPGTHPFIMMSYNDDLFSASTLAHELGHSLHSYLSWQTQPLIYARYTLFAAEVASNFNQAIVRDYLLRTQQDRDFQIGVIEEAMSNFHRYFFIMPTLARFELELHERAEQGQPLTADSFSSLIAELFDEGYGSDLEMDRLRTGSTWAQFSTHLYSNFYVYQYATGIAGAHALARGILDKKEGAVDRYLAFLRAGGSRYPLDALAAAGVDLRSPEPVEIAFGLLAEYVEQLEKLVGVG